MKLTKCIFDRKLIGKVNSKEIQETVADYVKEGLSPDAAMIRAVEEKVQSLRADRRDVMAQVRAEYDRVTGKDTTALYSKKDSVKPKSEADKDALINPTKGAETASPLSIDRDSGARINFEVAPDPNDAALSGVWNTLPQEKRLEISKDVAQKIIPQVLRIAGTKGRLTEQVGSYLDDTNPSFALVLADSAKADFVAKLAGYALSQDSMATISEASFAGGSRVGVVTIDIGKANPKEIYDALRKIEIDGKQLVEGQSTADGKMAILNYSEVSTPRLAAEIDRILDGRYTTNIDEVFAAFPTKQEYGYGSDRQEGAATPGRASVQGDADYLRNEATGLVRDAVRDASGKFSRADETSGGRADRAGGSDAAGDRRVREGDDGHGYGNAREGSEQVTGVHYSSQPRTVLDSSKYGTGMRGGEARRLDRNSATAEQRQRIHFYVDEGNGIQPESGVGAHSHAVDLRNMYNTKTDTLGFWDSAKEKYNDPSDLFNHVEQQAITNGFDGVYVPAAQGKQGVAVLIGKHTVDLKKPDPQFSRIDKEIEARLAGKLTNRFDDAVEEYNAINDKKTGLTSEGGQILNTDLARELSPDYQADRTKSSDVHEPASAFIKQLYAAKLAAPPPPGKDPLVFFTAGGTGAGKSSGLEIPRIASLAKRAEIIYDTNMNKLQPSIDKVEQALAAGREVHIMYVYRDPVDALVNGALPRAERMGRTVPIEEMEKTHVGAAEVAKDLAVRYAKDPRVSFTYIDNSQGKKNARVVDVADIPELEHNGLKEKLDEALETARVRNQISDTTYQGTRRYAADDAGDARKDGPLPQERGQGIRSDAQSQQSEEQVRRDAGGPDPLKFSKIDDLKETASDKLSAALKTPRQLLTDLKVATLPMGAGSETAKKMATDFADQGRRASWQWNKFDELLRNDFTEAQQEKMWIAADRENDLLREGRTSETEGLNSLAPEERKVVETLHAYGEALWQRATEAGMVETTGVHYWTPRTAALISDSGAVAPMPSKGGGVGKDGRNLSTTSTNTKHRSYDTTAEAEAAGKAAYGDDFTFVKNIRTMPMAMAKLERAIAGRELVNQIKAIGQATGMETVAVGERPDFFTMDHPSLKRWGPEYTDDGKVRLDETGAPVMTAKPLYISREFEGPLKAVLTRTHAMTDVYNSVMELKSKSMGLIMMSPMIHNAVEYGRALPAMLTADAATTGKNLLTLGAYTYVAGNRAKHDPAIMRDAVEHGLVPIGGRGQMVDIKGIADPASLEIGKSWTAKALAAGVGLIAGESGATATKKAVDAAGRFWHETLLWDRVADLQMGLYTTMRTSLLTKGASEYEASIAAAHFANRYAGALPQEAMSQGAREFLNLALFSRSFTAGNIGAMKDMFVGLPANRQAQIRLRAIEVAQSLGKSETDAQTSADNSLALVQSMARRKAVAAFVLDVGLMYLANSLTQDWLQREKLKDWAGWRESYAERKNALWDKVAHDPTAVLLHPFNSLQSLTSTGDNPEGKEERIKWGDDSAGNSIYMRLPFGKIGEEFLNYTTPGGVIKQIHNKLSPMLKPIIETYNNDRGFGKKVYDDSPESNVFKQAGQIAVNFMKAQVPYDMGQAAYDLARGKGDDMDVKKVVGPFVGLTFSKLTGGDAVAEQFKAAKDLQDRKMAVMDDVRRAIKYGEEDRAYELLEKAGLTPKEINNTINRVENPKSMPTRAQMKKFNQHATEDQKVKMDKLR